MGSGQERAWSFPLPGAWLYLGETCVLHPIDADPAPMVHSKGESLRMENIAFRAEDMKAFIAHLQQQDVAYKRFPFEALDFVLMFVRDPDGNRIHLDFAASEQN